MLVAAKSSKGELTRQSNHVGDMTTEGVLVIAELLTLWYTLRSGYAYCKVLRVNNKAHYEKT